MFFFFPFVFLIPFFLVFVALRFGTRLFQDYFRGSGRLDSRGRWVPGAGPRNPLDVFRLQRAQGLEARIFRAAYKQKGRLTLSDVVIETGLGIKEAEELINGMVDGLRVRMEVDDRGLVLYEFPEIIDRFEGR
jgi:hypothetical protein